MCTCIVQQYLIDKMERVEELLFFRAPPDCVQYLTGRAGEFQSYNQQMGMQLRDQSYDICLRQELGEGVKS